MLTAWFDGGRVGKDACGAGQDTRPVFICGPGTLSRSADPRTNPPGKASGGCAGQAGGSGSTPSAASVATSS